MRTATTRCTRLDPAMVGLETMLLMYSAGWRSFPARWPGSPSCSFGPGGAQRSRAVTSLLLVCGLLLEAAQIADTDSHVSGALSLHSRPAARSGVGLYRQARLPGRVPVGLLSAGAPARGARPASGYAAAHNKDDSPTLWAVLRFEGLTSVGNGSLVFALVAAALQCWSRSSPVRKLPAAVAVWPRSSRAARCLRAHRRSMPNEPEPA